MLKVSSSRGYDDRTAPRLKYIKKVRLFSENNYMPEASMENDWSDGADETELDRSPGRLARPTHVLIVLKAQFNRYAVYLSLLPRRVPTFEPTRPL